MNMLKSGYIMVDGTGMVLSTGGYNVTSADVLAANA